MRKENSEFITKFITDSGDFRKNRDYFAYLELDDLACWVLAEGLDSDRDILSSKKVVNSILSDFREKPSMSKRAVKRYIKNANKVLINQSKIVKLHSTVLVVVSDYKSIVWGSVGNTRLYHLRKEQIENKSKDHSVAQMMVDVGEVNSGKINQHVERNNLTAYLGEKKRVKPNLSKKIDLKDDDVLLFCTSGFWEKINDREIEKVLGESSEADEFVNNLEERMLNKDNTHINNYSIVSLFTKKIFVEEVKKGGFYKKVAMFLIPVLILTGGFFGYRKIKKINARKAARAIKIQEFKDSVSREEKGDQLIEKDEYNKALKEYKAAKKAYKSLKKDKKEKEIAEKIKRTNTIITAKNLEDKAENDFNNGNYEKSLKKYKEAKLAYLNLENYSLKDIENKIEKVDYILDGLFYETEGDIFFRSKNYSVAQEKYNLARNIYIEHKLANKETDVDRKISQTRELININKKEKEAKSIRLTADELLKMNKYDKAILKYMEAKIIYSELGMSEKTAAIEEKLAKITENRENEETDQKLKNALSLKEKGDQLFELEQYEKSLDSYIEAKLIYSQLDMTEKLAQVEKQITKIKNTQNEIKTNKTLKKAINLEKEGNELLEMKKFDQALFKYMEAKAVFNELDNTDKIAQIEEKLVEIKKKKNEFEKNIELEQAVKLEAKGDEFFQSKEFNNAIDKYTEAKIIYNKLNTADKVKKIKNKINNSVLTKNQLKAEKYEETGDMQLGEKNYDEALFNYKQALKIYNENNMSEGIEEINEKMTNTENRKNYSKAKEYEDLADVQFEKENYEEALSNYKRSKNIYSKIEKEKDIVRVEEKIKITDKKMDKFLGIF